MDIRLKRAHEPAAPADGYRVLIDRLWPRGSGTTRGASMSSAGDTSRSSATSVRGSRPSDFPTAGLADDTSYNGGGDAFLASLKRSNGALVYSSFLGGPAAMPATQSPSGPTGSGRT